MKAAICSRFSTDRQTDSSIADVTDLEQIAVACVIKEPTALG